MLVTRLHPNRAEVDVEELSTRLDLASRAPSDRPYVVLNMIASLDGRASLAGHSGGLGGETDRAIFHRLRTQVDGILVGAETVRVERYGRPVRSEELQALRARDGLAPNPPIVIVSARLALSSDLPLLADPGARVICITAAEGAIEGAAAQVEYLRVGDDLRLAMGLLRERHGIRSLLCEGGPTLNGYLLAAGLVDELYLSLSPMLVGAGEAPTLVTGPALPAPLDCEALWIAEADGALFTRWRVRGR